jgi:hypothetical protein
MDGSEHISPERLERYRERRLTAGELLAVHGHLAGCEPCRSQLLQLYPVRASLDALRADLAAALREPLHLSYDELAGYVDGALAPAEREVADSHLTLCTRCGEEVSDLRALRADLNARIEAAPRARIRASWPPRWLLLPAAAGLAAVLWLAVWELRSPPPVVGPKVIARESSSVATPASPSEVRVALNDGGGRVTLDAEGRLAGLPVLSPQAEAAVRAALETGRVETPAYFGGWVGGAGTLLGAAPAVGSLVLVGPLATAVDGDRPTLRWRPLAGATSYTAAVFDADLNPVAASPPLTGTEWRVPRSLPRGRDYSWQVTAMVEAGEVNAPAPPAPEARFRVLERSLSEEMRRARAASQGSGLLLGLAYARVGLLEDAERELRALAEANPGSSLAQSLWRSVRARRPQPESPTTTKPAQ